MHSFNSHIKAKSPQEQLLCDLNTQLTTMDKQSPAYTQLLARIEHMQYDLHRARMTTRSTNSANRRVAVRKAA